jgi:hypothetical protein
VGRQAAGRYREATGAQQITIETNVAATQMLSLTTTPEGGAIVGGYGNVYAVASNASTPVALGVSPFAMQAAARGTSTFVVAQTLAPTSQPALYAYDEMGGQPRLTRLTPDTRDMQAFPIDAPKGPRSAWFAYGASTCNLARIIYSNGDPTIDQTPCAAINDVRGIGATSNGTVIAMDADDGIPSASHIYALTANGGSEVAHFPTQPTVLYDRASVNDPIVAWYGTDAMGTVACLANSPDRCWTIGGTIGPIFVVAGSMGTGDTFAIEGVTTTSSSITATIVRTLGPGDRVPPLL